MIGAEQSGDVIRLNFKISQNENKVLVIYMVKGKETNKRTRSMDNYSFNSSFSSSPDAVKVSTARNA